MSLNFQFEDKERFNKLTDEEKKQNDIFIWGCLLIDLGEITEKNAEEWHWRYCFANKVNGPFYTVKGEPYEPTLEEVQKRIGLHTNVSNRTRNQFIQKVVRIYSRK